MAKPKLHPLDNKLHSELFFLILEGKNYAQLISNIQKKTPAIVIRQINELLQLGLLQKKKELRLNKTIYSINWQNVVLSIFKIYDDKQKLFYECHTKLEKELKNKKLTKQEKNFKTFRYFGSKTPINNLINNKEALSFIINFFINYVEVTKNQERNTLREIFTKFLLNLFMVKTNEGFIKEIQKKKGIKEFIDSLPLMWDMDTEYIIAIFLALCDKGS